MRPTRSARQQKSPKCPNQKFAAIDFGALVSHLLTNFAALTAIFVPGQQLLTTFQHQLCW
jgi:hypothetical protein